jgi:chemotaxis family two-component system sensor kinase Cph1
VLVIGDVVGHDTEAAATMGQLRGLLRGITYDSADSPAGVLTRLDRAIAGLEIDAMASVLVARLEQTPEEVARGVTRLRWSNAGHLPPVVVDADGQIQVLDGARADLLLGVEPGARRRDHVLTVSRGATVLLYTDGLVERRDQLFDTGVDQLREELRTLWELPVHEVADQLLARLVPERAEDDVALVAVRLNPQLP